MRIPSVMWVLILTVALAGCQYPLQEVSLSSEELPPTQGGGQLPEQVVREASARYGGSMEPDIKTSSTQEKSTRLSVALGTISSQRSRDGGQFSRDVEKRIRDVIARRISLHKNITMLDSPGERLFNDSTRPDLARRGIKLVIKGVASYNKSSGETTVFLRGVETATGKISIAASGRAGSPDLAAAQAANRLLEKLKGASDEGIRDY